MTENNKIQGNQSKRDSGLSSSQEGKVEDEISGASPFISCSIDQDQEEIDVSC